MQLQSNLEKLTQEACLFRFGHNSKQPTKKYEFFDAKQLSKAEAVLMIWKNNSFLIFQKEWRYLFAKNWDYVQANF